MARSDAKGRGALREVVLLFARLGLTAFGGPAAHISMMEDEVVRRRKWVSEQHFLDLVGATNLIPGPNSTEMAIHLGFERAGWPGLLAGGASFIVPAVCITGILAFLYVRYGTVPEAGPVLFGIKPAAVAVILSAVWRLGRRALKGWRGAVLGLLVASAALAGTSEILCLVAGGLGGMVWFRWASGGDEGRGAAAAVASSPAGPGAPATAIAAGAGATAAAVSLWKLGLFFLKVGAILYGSGYVLVAFLQGDLVERYGWLTQGQLLDAVAVGQFTPGPVLSTATFIGYVLAGVPGALVATLGIFLPSFAFVAALNPLIPRLRESRWAGAFLDAVNVAAVALMAAVTVQLGESALRTWEAWVVFAGAATAVLGLRLNAAWAILGGAALGFALRLL
jgi:chromate transporter